MDEALDWLVRLQCADAADTQAFEAWLSAAPENAEAYVEAEALWNGTPLHKVATHMHQQQRRSWRGRLRSHWKPWPPQRCCWSGYSPSVTCPCACR